MEAVEHLVEGHTCLQTGESACTQTEVDPVAEAEVVADSAVDVEYIAVRWERPVVAIA